MPYSITSILIAIFLISGTHLCSAQEKSEMALTVSPAFKWLTEGTPYGDLRITNDGTVPSEIIITTTGLDEPSEIGDLSTYLTIFPPRMILSPGETKILRYAIMDVAPITEGGHVAIIKAQMARRTPVDQAQIPVAAAALRINYEMIIPIILIKGVGEPEIEATVISQTDDQLILAMINRGNSPWSGMIYVESQDGQSLFGSIGATIFQQRDLEIDLIAPLSETFKISFEERWTPERSLRTPAPLLFTR